MICPIGKLAICIIATTFLATAPTADAANFSSEKFTIPGIGYNSLPKEATHNSYIIENENNTELFYSFNDSNKELYTPRASPGNSSGVNDPIPPGIPTHGLSILTNDPYTMIQGPLFSTGSSTNWLRVSGRNITLLCDGKPVKHFRNISDTIFTYENGTLLSSPVNKSEIILPSELGGQTAYRDFQKSKINAGKGLALNPNNVDNNGVFLDENGLPLRDYGTLTPEKMNPNAIPVSEQKVDMRDISRGRLFPTRDGEIYIRPEDQTPLAFDSLSWSYILEVYGSDSGKIWKYLLKPN